MDNYVVTADCLLPGCKKHYCRNPFILIHPFYLFAFVRKEKVISYSFLKWIDTKEVLVSFCEGKNIHRLICEHDFFKVIVSVFIPCLFQTVDREICSILIS